jgi:superfamily II DNA helicase RecQ
VLALTATANSRIQQDIMQHLGMTYDEGSLLALPNKRGNLSIFARLVKSEDEKNKTIVSLLKQSVATIGDDIDIDDRDDETNKAQSAARMELARNRRRGVSDAKKQRRPEQSPLTIVYVGRRDEADSLGEYLRGCDVSVAVYHAGMDAQQREKSQRMFDRSTARCVVATVAFGMGR